MHGFHDDLKELYEGPAPAAYADLPRPLMGYTGTVDGRIDFNAVSALSERFRRVRSCLWAM